MSYHQNNFSPQYSTAFPLHIQNMVANLDAKFSRAQFLRMGRTYLSAIIQKIVFTIKSNSQARIQDLCQNKEDKQKTTKQNSKEDMMQLEIHQIMKKIFGEKIIQIFAMLLWQAATDTVQEIITYIFKTYKTQRQTNTNKEMQIDQQNIEQFSLFNCTSFQSDSQISNQQSERPNMQPFVTELSEIGFGQQVNRKQQYFVDLQTNFQSSASYTFKSRPYPSYHFQLSAYISSIPVYRSQINLLSQLLKQPLINYHRQKLNDSYYVKAEYVISCRQTNFESKVFYGQGYNAMLKMASETAAYQILWQVFSNYPAIWKKFISIKQKKGLQPKIHK